MQRAAADRGQRRAILDPLQESVDSNRGTLENGLDPTVLAVAHEAVHAALGGLASRRLAKQDALNPTVYQHPHALHVSLSEERAATRARSLSRTDPASNLRALAAIRVSAAERVISGSSLPFLAR